MRKSSGAHTRLRPKPLQQRLQAIHEALASDRPAKETIAAILHEVSLTVSAPKSARLYRIDADGQVYLEPLSLPAEGALATAQPSLTLPRTVRQALVQGRHHICLEASVLSGHASPPGPCLVWPVRPAGNLAACIVVPLPEPTVTRAQKGELAQWASLLAVALRQVQLLVAAQGQPGAEETDTTLARIVAGVAHELNNPLAIIAGSAQVLLRSHSLPEAQADLERIDRGARRAAQVMRDLLAFARQQPMATTIVQVPDLVREVLSQERVALSEGGIDLAEEIDDGVPAVHGDRLQLAQVLSLLIANARHAISSRPGASHLAIKVSHHGGLRLSVSDDGPGIPPDQLPRVFEPFPPTQEPGHGTGLSLAVCQSLVRAHGGRIWATNNPTGGCTFHVELPPHLGQPGLDAPSLRA